MFSLSEGGLFFSSGSVNIVGGREAHLARLLEVLVHGPPPPLTTLLLLIDTALSTFFALTFYAPPTLLLRDSLFRLFLVGDAKKSSCSGKRYFSRSTKQTHCILTSQYRASIFVIQHYVDSLDFYIWNEFKGLVVYVQCVNPVYSCVRAVTSKFLNPGLVEEIIIVLLFFLMNRAEYRLEVAHQYILSHHRVKLSLLKEAEIYGAHPDIVYNIFLFLIINKFFFSFYLPLLLQVGLLSFGGKLTSSVSYHHLMQQIYYKLPTTRIG